jgi:hypothetical protein
MAQGLLGGVLPAIYSGADQLKRGVYGLLTDPMEQARRAGQSLLQSRADRNDLMARTFANPERPFQVTDQAGLAQLGDQVMSGELGFAPIGMTSKVTGGLLDTSYRGSHTAPNAKEYGARLDDLTTLMPQDVYSQQGKRLYGIGNPQIDSEWYVAALRAKNKPDAEIEIFRAVPKGVKDINDGDWITTSKTYADWHGENVLNGEYDIISKKVKAKTLSSEGYPYEFGYNPE